MTLQPPRPGASLTVALVVAALALAGCVRAPASSPPPAAEAGGGTYVYTCPDGYRFSVRFRGDSALVELPGRSLALPHVISADGARYEAEGVEFWGKGMQASLETGTGTYRGCEGVRADGPEEARTGGSSRWMEAPDRLTLYAGDRPLAVFRVGPGR